FVRSMLVGSSGIDLGLLVVAADEGVMPQTREHLLILDLLKIPRVVVAITKCDLVDSEWLALVRDEILALFEATGRQGPPVVSCSSRTGEGLPELREVLRDSLSSGDARTSDDLFRLPIDRAFTVRGTGTVVTGTVWSGVLQVEENVVVLPSHIPSRVRRIEQHGATASHARAGSRAAIALAGVDLRDVSRGSVLVRDGFWRSTSLFEAAVTLDAGTAEIIKPRTKIRLHAGASEVGAKLVGAAGKTTGPVTLMRVTTDAPLVLRGGDRFVLRLPAPVRTVGGGFVIDPYARRRSLPPGRRDDIASLSSSATARLAFILEAEGVRGVRIEEMPVRAGCSPAEVAALVEQRCAHAGPHNLFASYAVEQVMASVRRIIAEYEIKSPLSLGVPSRTLREGLRVQEELADISIREMERAGEVELRGPLMRRTGWLPSPSQRDLETANNLAHDICAGGQEPPSVGELTSRYGSSVPGLLRFLERQGRVVHVETERYYDRDTLVGMIARLRGKLVPGQVYAPAQLRDILGFSRKYLIPFLEYCDRNNITERRGEGRVLRETAEALLDSFQARS
ncbi:MAG: SelB C-terminal domain-containing protein, partial [Gemmatimonadales bacterium]